MQFHCIFYMQSNESQRPTDSALNAQRKMYSSNPHLIHIPFKLIFSRYGACVRFMDRSNCSIILPNETNIHKYNTIFKRIQTICLISMLCYDNIILLFIFYALNTKHRA